MLEDNKVMEQHKHVSGFLIAILLLTGALNSQAAVQETKAPKVITDVDLKSYMDNLPDDFVVEKMDSQNKGSPDMFIVFKKGDNQSRNLIYQLFDFNRDGKIDMVNHFQKGKKIKTEFDLDFDGKVDSVVEYDPESGQPASKTLVEDGNLTWKFWHKAELRRKEVDRNADGKPDMWVHYRNGHAIKTEIDVNFDGKNIRLEGDLSKNR